MTSVVSTGHAAGSGCTMRQSSFAAAVYGAALEAWLLIALSLQDTHVLPWLLA